jgi:hypothetical protein
MAVFVAQYRKGLKSGTVLVPDSCLFNNPEGCNGLGQKLAILEDFDLDTLNLKLTTDHLWNSLLPSPVDGSRAVLNMAMLIPTTSHGSLMDGI